MSQNTSTQGSIMNAHNTTQFTHVRFKCVLKYSSCDIPLSMIFKLTILDTDTSLSSTKVIKWSHIKNDSIFTHNDSRFKVSKSISTHTLKKMNTAHDLTYRFARIFRLTFVTAHSRSKRSF